MALTMMHDSLTQFPVLLEVVHRLKLKKKTFRKPALLPSSGKETPTLMEPLEWAILLLGGTETLILLRYVPDNRWSPRVVPGKEPEKEPQDSEEINSELSIN